MFIKIERTIYTLIFIIPFIFFVAMMCSSIGSAEFKGEPRLPSEEDNEPQLPEFEYHEPQLPEEYLEPELPDYQVEVFVIDELESCPEVLYQLQTSEDAIIALCKMTYGEARGCSKVEQAACIWCALNRVDSKLFSNDIIKVVSQKYQFDGYILSNPVTKEIRELVEDVLMRWELEKLGEEDVGRVLPSQYLWFHGDGKHNYFRDAYLHPYNIWDWSLPNPYEN